MNPCDVCEYDLRDRPRPGVEQWALVPSGARIWVCDEHIKTADDWFGRGAWS